MISKNKVAIITGGSRGIGRAISETFAQEGFRVVITSRTVAELKKTTKELRLISDGIRWVRADISKEKDVVRLVRYTLGVFGRIDVLVNNAGVLGPVGKITHIKSADWLKTLHINLGGVFLCAKAVVPQMVKQKSGSIINLSGGGAVSARENFSAYAASKAAVVRFTETLAREVAPYGIRVNAISPGAVNTRMIQQIVEMKSSVGRQEYKNALRCIKKGGVSPYLAAELALFLATPESRGLTGKVISAPWDDWESFGRNYRKINASSLYTLRRIDGRFFKEAKA